MGEVLEEKDNLSRKIDIEDENETSDENISKESVKVSENGDAQEENSSEDAAEEKPDEIEELKAKLSEYELKVSDLNDRYVRSHAELENFKKRTKKEVSDFKKFAVEAIVKQLLPVFDNLERAVFSVEASGESESCQITQGIKMTLGEIDRVFDQFNIKSVDARGEKFNPEFHMAVGQEERDDVEENIVINQFQKGYMLHDRLIRPAMVTISKLKKAPETEENAEEPEKNEKTDQE